MDTAKIRLEIIKNWKNFSSIIKAEFMDDDHDKFQNPLIHLLEGIAIRIIVRIIVNIFMRLFLTSKQTRNEPK